MMMQMSKEYAEALFALAKENGIEDIILGELRTVLELFDENPEYVVFMSSPSIPKNERLDALENAFSGKFHEYTVSFVELLCERSRINSFHDCVKDYEALYNQSKQVLKAHVTSAVPLTDDEKEKLKIKLEKKSGNTLILECDTDESILGGVIVELDGKIMDGSLKHRLQEVKEVIDR